MAAPRRLPAPFQTLQLRLQNARAHSDALFGMLAPAALYHRPIPERHRLIFYLGHLEAFDWNLLGRGAFELESENAAFDELFSFGIDPTKGDLPTDVSADWPAESAVRAYGARVRERLDEHLVRVLAHRASKPEVADNTLLHVAIEHRLMHVETLAYLLHQLPSEQKRREHAPVQPAHRIARAQVVKIPDGCASLGLPRESGAVTNRHAAFGWDNEFPATNVLVPAFGIGAYPVTNAEYLEFVRSGGYEDRNFWSAGDWDWRSASGVSHPRFWIRRGDKWIYRGMFEESPLPLSWPVYVSYAEASAYARWAGKSLPTEAQWHRVAYGTPGGAERAYPWGDAPPDHTRGNFDFAAWDPMPVTAHPAGASGFGAFDLLGNGWEWTSTPFGPLPGFRPFAFYPGYSANFFDGRHFVMKGGSQRTAACMLRRSFRNWFQPHYPYVYAKFRCVED